MAKLSDQSYIKEFSFHGDGLSSRELSLVKKLTEAAHAFADVYKAQLAGRSTPLFYPEDATNQEIEKEALKDPQILSPYTVVERDSSGKLVAIPYHQKYKEQLSVVSKKIKEAISICHDSKFANILTIASEALLNDNYPEARKAYLSYSQQLIDVIFGPIENFEDDRFHVKRSYQGWVGVMHKSLTEKANNFQQIAFTMHRRMFSPTEKVEFMDKARIRVDNTVVLSGEIAKASFTAATLPNEIDLIEKYGSRARIFLPMVRGLFESKHLSIFRSIFSKEFQQSFSEEDLSRGYLHTVILHEIARALIRYKFAEVRLKELQSIVYEMAVEALAIKLSGNLLLKDVLSQKEMESILVMFLTRIFDYYYEMKDNPSLKVYVLGNAVLLNSLIDQGALKVAKDGISWPNFTKMFISVSNVADEMEKLLAEGTYKDAQHYLDEHSSLTVFKQFKLNFDKSNPKK